MPNPSHKVLQIGHFLIPFLLFSVLIGFSGCLQREAIPTKDFNSSLVVPLFKNATFEPLLEKTLTTIFKRTLHEQGWQVNENSDQRAKVLVGRITAFRRQPISLDQVGSVREYRIHIVLEVILLEAKGEEKRFSRTVKGAAEYIARSDSGADRIAKDGAIREAGRDMAVQVADLLRNVVNQSEKGRK